MPTKTETKTICFEKRPHCSERFGYEEILNEWETDTVSALLISHGKPLS